MKQYINSRKTILLALTVLTSTVQMSCENLIEVDTPYTNSTSTIVYSSNNTATAVLTGILAKMSTLNSTDYSMPNIGTTSVFVGLSADELALFNPGDLTLGAYWQNALNNERGEFWNSIYPLVYNCNSAIEGLNNSTMLNPEVKTQLLGEAKFMRAFLYFHLVNLYGDVPLILTSDYITNAQLPRTAKDDVMAQIVTDLKEAQSLLKSDYVGANVLNATDERVRPNKWAATALLARAYLYQEDYANAVAQSSLVIANTAQYGIEPLNNVFVKNNKESIWQIQATGSFFSANTGEGMIFKLPATGPDFSHIVYMSNGLANSFEAGDQRKENWVGSAVVGATTYYYPNKYKIGSEFVPTSEYSTVLRLAEQYLIRAEAYAKLNKLTEAKNDLLVVRNRAGLLTTTAATKDELLSAILQERKVELFTEWGHRWFDLKRTGKIDAVMTAAALLKGSTWATTKALYPIPLFDLQANNKLVPNPGY
ncbi:RagB/SusD family nutrient uptake outer membrane protein [Solitalea longa]|uniref:RagB/SusD family nutrient uptake outer membrane protein n=1 Tax=Solitalea longa TaxID=2079460 RepID=A0A2S5A5X1_9SPHI|nr:RagB/SusD family nutrient uptake outer membrane protein [Solitalea longa]POY37914.1 RagB/SusD family nutrient uptake outer membrane protein [Solitalea longa]